MPKYTYSFEEENKDMKHLLGGKGANLAVMTSLDIPVPHGFTITTEACDFYYKNEGKCPEELAGQINEKLAKLEEKNRKEVWR